MAHSLSSPPRPGFFNKFSSSTISSSPTSSTSPCSSVFENSTSHFSSVSLSTCSPSPTPVYMSGIGVGCFAWLRHSDLEWIPAEILEDVGGGVEGAGEWIVRTENGEILQVEKKELMDVVHPTTRKGVSDLLLLSEFTEGSLLHNVRTRYQQQRIYTAIGSHILVALNPYMDIPNLYSEETARKYRHLDKECNSIGGGSVDRKGGASSEKQVEPHLFAVAQQAYSAVYANHRDQSLIISGESGAGKTEATKRILRYLATLDEQGPQLMAESIESQVLKSNPILEAFGNAKTVRNDNSSRFGKFIQVHFDQQTGRLHSARISNYLLEKCRIVTQQPNERNYHVFYQLARGEYTPPSFSTSAPPSPSPSSSFISSSFTELPSSSGFRTLFHLDSPSRFRYLKPVRGREDRDLTTPSHTPSITTTSLEEDEAYVTDLNDREKFDELLDCLRILHFTEDSIMQIFALTAGVLHLGNLTFTDPSDCSGSCIEEEEVERSVCEMLKLEKSKFQDVFKYKTMLAPTTSKGRTQVIKVPRRRAEAESVRDAMAKALYSRLFDWLVKKINRAMTASSDCKKSMNDNTKNNSMHANVRSKDGGKKKASSMNSSISSPLLTIGLLDIYGFEVFDVNSFEQLCINYANERLQQHFNIHIFSQEQHLYTKENIVWSHIRFQDNQSIIDALDKKRIGLFSLLDDQVRLPQTNDQHFVNRVLKEADTTIIHKGSSALRPYSFLVDHYAGVVEYQGDSFLEKNKDTLHQDVTSCLMASRRPLVKYLFKLEKLGARNQNVGNGGGGSPPSGAAAGGGLHSVTVSSSFRCQLNGLVKSLAGTNPSYIRCIKPNQYKAPLTFESNQVLRQLRCAGTLESIRIRKAGYPVRRDFREFFLRYRVLSPGLVDANYLHLSYDRYAQLSRQLLISFVKETLGDAKGDEVDMLNTIPWQIGRTMVFLKEGLVVMMERKCLEKMTSACATIVKWMKGLLVRRRYLNVLAGVRKVQRRWLTWSVRRGYMQNRTAAIYLQAYFRMRKQRALYIEELALTTIASVAIQRRWRGVLGRRVARKAKIEAIRRDTRNKETKRLLEEMEAELRKQKEAVRILNNNIIDRTDEKMYAQGKKEEQEEYDEGEGEDEEEVMGTVGNGRIGKFLAVDTVNFTTRQMEDGAKTTSRLEKIEEVEEEEEEDEKEQILEDNGEPMRIEIGLVNTNLLESKSETKPTLIVVKNQEEAVESYQSNTARQFAYTTSITQLSMPPIHALDPAQDGLRAHGSAPVNASRPDSTQGTGHPPDSAQGVSRTTDSALSGEILRELYEMVSARKQDQKQQQLSFLPTPRREDGSCRGCVVMEREVKTAKRTINHLQAQVTRQSVDIERLSSKAYNAETREQEALQNVYSSKSKLHHFEKLADTLGRQLSSVRLRHEKSVGSLRERLRSYLRTQQYAHAQAMQQARQQAELAQRSVYRLRLEYSEQALNAAKRQLDKSEQVATDVTQDSQQRVDGLLSNNEFLQRQVEELRMAKETASVHYEMQLKELRSNYQNFMQDKEDELDVYKAEVAMLKKQTHQGFMGGIKRIFEKASPTPVTAPDGIRTVKRVSNSYYAAEEPVLVYVPHLDKYCLCRFLDSEEEASEQRLEELCAQLTQALAEIKLTNEKLKRSESTVEQLRLMEIQHNGQLATLQTRLQVVNEAKEQYCQSYEQIKQMMEGSRMIRSRSRHELRRDDDDEERTYRLHRQTHLQIDDAMQPLAADVEAEVDFMVSNTFANFRGSNSPSSTDPQTTTSSCYLPPPLPNFSSGTFPQLPPPPLPNHPPPPLPNLPPPFMATSAAAAIVADYSSSSASFQRDMATYTQQPQQFTYPINSAPYQIPHPQVMGSFHHYETATPPPVEEIYKATSSAGSSATSPQNTTSNASSSTPRNSTTPTSPPVFSDEQTPPSGGEARAPQFSEADETPVFHYQHTPYMVMQRDPPAQFPPNPLHHPPHPLRAAVVPRLNLSNLSGAATRPQQAQVYVHSPSGLRPMLSASSMPPFSSHMHIPPYQNGSVSYHPSPHHHHGPASSLPIYRQVAPPTTFSSLHPSSPSLFPPIHNGYTAPPPNLYYHHPQHFYPSPPDYYIATSTPPATPPSVGSGIPTPPTQATPVCAQSERRRHKGSEEVVTRNGKAGRRVEMAAQTHQGIPRDEIASQHPPPHIAGGSSRFLGKVKYEDMEEIDDEEDEHLEEVEGGATLLRSTVIAADHQNN